MLPLNIVIPATNREAASVFLGATALERRRTPEWISCEKYRVSFGCSETGERAREERGERYLVLRCGAPIRDSSWICNLLLQAMSAKCTQCDRGGAIDAAECPEWERHCLEVVDDQLRLWLKSD